MRERLNASLLSQHGQQSTCMYFSPIIFQLQKWRWELVHSVKHKLKTDYNECNVLFDLYLTEYSTKTRYLMFKLINWLEPAVRWTEKVCCDLMSPHFKLFLEIMYVVSGGIKRKSAVLIVTSAKFKKPECVMYRRRVFPRRPCLFNQDNAKTHSARYNGLAS